VSLLALLDLQHNSPFLVFVFLFSHTFIKFKKNSVVLLLKNLWEVKQPSCATVLMRLMHNSLLVLSHHLKLRPINLK
jgi:hypothetical protein